MEWFTITEAAAPDCPEGMNDRNCFWQLNYKHPRPLCRALVLSAGDGKHSRVLDFIGPDFDYRVEVDSGQFQDEEFSDLPAGIWIVEGSVHHYGPDYYGEYDEEVDASHRALTTEEWEGYTINDCPWDRADWGTPWVHPETANELP